ncbi:MAG: hypothetical protein R3C18_15690 [Planctomycetaceae bacterium]
MSFDAYHKWLGIPPQQQPPHHYRLLGVDPFEADVDVIEAAANQRLAYLQDLATGEHVAESQKLLNEISQARRTLLNPDKKFLYDMELRKQLEAAAPKPATSERPKEDKQRRHLLVIGGVMAALVLVVGLFFMSQGGNGNSGGEMATVELDWPLDQREGAQVIVQGKPMALPGEPIARLTVPVGRYAMTLQRSGYEDINVNLVMLPGDLKQLRPAWRPAR